MNERSEGLLFDAPKAQSFSPSANEFIILVDFSAAECFCATFLKKWLLKSYLITPQIVKHLHGPSAWVDGFRQ